MSEQPLLTTYHADKLASKNRVVLAPMTRDQADNEGNVPTDLMVMYYMQRASAALLISEGVFVSPETVGFIANPDLVARFAQYAPLAQPHKTPSERPILRAIPTAQPLTRNQASSPGRAKVTRTAIVWIGSYTY